MYNHLSYDSKGLFLLPKHRLTEDCDKVRISPKVGKLSSNRTNFERVVSLELSVRVAPSESIKKSLKTIKYSSLFDVAASTIILTNLCFKFVNSKLVEESWSKRKLYLRQPLNTCSPGVAMVLQL